MFIKLEAEKCKFIRGNFLIYVNIKLQVYYIFFLQKVGLFCFITCFFL